MRLGNKWHALGLTALIGGVGYFGLLPYARFGLIAHYLDDIDPFRIRHGAAVAVPPDQLVMGAVKDQIPALTDPAFVPAPAAPGWLTEEERVVGVVHNGVAKAYPTKILLWHEAVNDTVGGKPYLVTY